MARTTKLFIVGGLLVAAAIALFVAPFASSSPDGLEKVAADEGFDGAEVDHRLGDGPLADYQVDGSDDERIGTAVAGAIGVLLTFGLGLGVVALAGSVSTRRQDSGDSRRPGVNGRDEPTARRRAPPR